MTKNKTVSAFNPPSIPPELLAVFATLPVDAQRQVLAAYTQPITPTPTMPPTVATPTARPQHPAKIDARTWAMVGTGVSQSGNPVVLFASKGSKRDMTMPVPRTLYDTIRSSR